MKNNWFYDLLVSAWEALTSFFFPAAEPLPPEPDPITPLPLRIIPAPMLKPELQKAVFEAIGAASMCWDPIPFGVFDSTKAMRIGDALVAKLTGEAPPLETFPASKPSTTTSVKPDNIMLEQKVEGSVILIALGYIAINELNGRVEAFEGAKILPGLTGGNWRAMITEQKELELKFAKAAELTTDASSPDDAVPAGNAVPTTPASRPAGV